MHSQHKCLGLPRATGFRLLVCHRPANLQAKNLVLGFNRLVGPAFPPAWLQAGAMPRLEDLALSHNGLSGTLPTNLTWPYLASL
jgi:hypothetical protein